MEESTKSLTCVRPGQIWRDNDCRVHPTRYVRINSIDAKYAYCSATRDTVKGEPCWFPSSTTPTRIKVSRFRPNATGYVLVREAVNG